MIQLNQVEGITKEKSNVHQRRAQANRSDNCTADGQVGRLKAMVNGRDWSTLEDGGLQFTFSGKRGVNKCLVHLRADDTYTMEFWYCKLNKKTYEFKSEMKADFDGLYWDMLISTFEEYTSLYLGL